jgi:hypothetical protein
MTEHTSVEISKRLAEAGFEVTPPDAMWGIDPITKEWRIDTWYYAINERRAYRADTLLTWLLDKGVGVYIDRKNGVVIKIKEADNDNS